MGGRLAIALLLLFVGWSTLRLVFRAWAVHPSVDPKWLRRTALTGMAAVPGWLAVAFNWRSRKPFIHAPGVLDHPWAVVVLAWVVAALCLFLLVRGPLRLFGDFALERDLETNAHATEADLRREGLAEDLTELREVLMVEFAERTGRFVTLRFGDRFALPFSKTPGEIYIPVRFITGKHVQHLNCLLDHEVDHLRLGHDRLARIFRLLRSMLPFASAQADVARKSLEIECDRACYSAMDEAARHEYEVALHEAVSEVVGDIDIGVIGHNPEHVPIRIDQMKQRPLTHTNARFMASVVGLFLVVGTGLWAVGALDVGKIWRAATLRPGNEWIVEPLEAGAFSLQLPWTDASGKTGVFFSTKGCRKPRSFVMSAGLMTEGPLDTFPRVPGTKSIRIKLVGRIPSGTGINFEIFKRISRIDIGGYRKAVLENVCFEMAVMDETAQTFTIRIPVTELPEKSHPWGPNLIVPAGKFGWISRVEISPSTEEVPPQSADDIVSSLERFHAFLKSGKSSHRGRFIGPGEPE